MLVKPSVGIILLLCAMSGCVSSEHGLALPGDEKVAFDPTLLGNWESSVDPSVGFSGGFLRVERLGDEGKKTYALTWSMDGQAAPGQEPQQAKGSLVAIGDSRYFDIVAVATKDGDRHWFLKVKQQKNDLSIQLMNSNYFPSHPKALAHRFENGGRGPIQISSPVITANTPEICRFLEQNQNNPELWIEEYTMRFRRR